MEKKESENRDWSVILIVKTKLKNMIQVYKNQGLPTTEP